MRRRRLIQQQINRGGLTDGARYKSGIVSESSPEIFLTPNGDTFTDASTGGSYGTSLTQSGVFDHGIEGLTYGASSGVVLTGLFPTTAPSSLTLLMWASRSDYASSSGDKYLSRITAAGFNIYFYFRDSDDNLRVLYAPSATANSSLVYDTSGFASDSVHQFGITYSPSELQLIVNGSVVGTATPTTAIDGASSTQIFLGCGAIASTPLNGNIHDILIDTNEAYDAPTISALYDLGNV